MLVVVAAAIGLITAVMVELPDEIPGVALEAMPVYRLEVGGAIFVGLYFVSMAIVLAVHNRGFTEFGTGGLRAESLNDVSETVVAQENSLRLLSEIVYGWGKEESDEVRGGDADG